MLDQATITLPDPFPGEFRFLRLLGEGAFGSVWLADDLNLGIQVAIKTLHARDGMPLSPPARDYLRREARLLAQVRHPNVVHVYAWRSDKAGDFMVLQYVPGGSLDTFLKLGALDWGRAGRYVADVAEGLLEVHHKGIVHRDIKPANILLDSQRDEALLGDFGVANWPDDACTIAGSRAYMAPEVVWGNASEVSDVFSLAATLFHLTTGELPFAAAGNDQTGLPEPDPRFAAVPAGLEQLIRSALTRNAASRPCLTEFNERLRSVLNAALVDSLVPPRPARPDDAAVWLRVSLVRPDGGSVPIAASRPPTDSCLRDLKKVPRQPDRLSVCTGERVRIEVEAAQSGHVTVFNIGPTGTLNLLYPDSEGQAPPPLRPQTPLHIMDVELTPPAGHERVFAVWTMTPLAMGPEELRSLAEGKPGEVSRPYRATRDMVKVKEGLAGRPAGSWQVAVVELDHVSHSHDLGSTV